MSNATCNINVIVNGWVQSTYTLIKSQVYTVYKCSYTDEVWIGQPDSQRTVDVEGDSCVDNTGTVVLSVRHITGSTYERATHQRVDVRETSGITFLW